VKLERNEDAIVGPLNIYTSANTRIFVYFILWT